MIARECGLDIFLCSTHICVITYTICVVISVLFILNSEYKEYLKKLLYTSIVQIIISSNNNLLHLR